MGEDMPSEDDLSAHVVVAERDTVALKKYTSLIGRQGLQECGSRLLPVLCGRRKIRKAPRGCCRTGLNIVARFGGDDALTRERRIALALGKGYTTEATGRNHCSDSARRLVLTNADIGKQQTSAINGWKRTRVVRPFSPPPTIRMRPLSE